MAWHEGQPDNGVYTGSEAANSGGVSGDEDVVEMDMRSHRGGEGGLWNDGIEAGNNHAGYMSGMYPLCETSDSSDEVAFGGELGSGQRIQYVGCYSDELGHDGEHTEASGFYEGHTMGDCEYNAANGINDGSAMNHVYAQDGTHTQSTGLGRCRDLNGAHFGMGAEASPEKCAELCAGYAYFGLQYYNHCL